MRVPEHRKITENFLSRVDFISCVTLETENGCEITWKIVENSSLLIIEPTVHQENETKNLLGKSFHLKKRWKTRSGNNFKKNSPCSKLSKPNKGKVRKM